LYNFGVNTNRTALLVSPYEQDRIALDQIFWQEKWELAAVASLDSALTFLSHTTVPLVICERELPGFTWKDVLSRTSALGHAPNVVVISSDVDEHLWAEVLNLGAHDLLAKPLSEAEVRWVVGHAFAKWQVEEGVRRPRIRVAPAPTPLVC
jgi:DNA-binding NtrC family response regulator